MTRASMDGPHDPDCPCGWCRGRGPASREELIEAASREAAAVILFSTIEDREGIRVASDAIAQRIVALVEPWVRRDAAEEEKARADLAITMWEQEAKGARRVTTERIVAALQQELTTSHRVFYDDDPYGSTVIHGEQQVRDDAAAIARKAGLADD